MTNSSHSIDLLLLFPSRSAFCNWSCLWDLHVLLGVAIALLLFAMSVSIASSWFDRFYIFAALRVRYFGEGNDTATREPATYWTLAPTLLIRAGCLLLLAEHTLAEQPVSSEARHSDDVVGPQANAWLVCAGRIDADSPALWADRQPAARHRAYAFVDACPRTFLLLLCQLLTLWKKLIRQYILGERNRLSTHGQRVLIAAFDDGPFDAIATFLALLVEHLL